MKYLALVVLFLLFFFPEVAMDGSKYGIQLWLTQLIPTLLPCFVLTGILQEHAPAVSGKKSYLLLGILCGYPVGASLVTSQYSKNLLSRKQAYFYLGFVNAPSPSFVLLFCGSLTLGLTPVESFELFALLLASSVMGSIVFSLFYSPRKTSLLPVSPICPPSPTAHSLEKIILRSFKTLCLIGFYVCFCSILNQLIFYLIPCPSWFQSLLGGLMEITYGMSVLQALSISLQRKRILALSLLAFGGISALLQTSSILYKAELSLIPYLICKITNGIIAALLGYSLFYIL